MHPTERGPGASAGRPAHLPRGRKTLWRKLRLALGLGPRRWADLVVAAWALLRGRVVFGRLSAKELVAHLERGAEGAQTSKASRPHPGPPDAETAAYLARLDWSIAAMGNALPWRSDCLIRCLAADRLLRKRGLVPEFRIGVSKTAAGDLAAHAWTWCQGIPVAGGDGAGFEVLIGPEKAGGSGV